MAPRARTRDAEVPTARERGIAPGASVVLHRPTALRGVLAVVRRRLPSGWEVEIRTALGTPVHLTVRARALRPR